MTNLDQLKDLLAELFMLDQADLDFGIYRVMNAKRAEVTRFLDSDLLPQVRAELEKVQTGDRAGLENELAKAIAAARAAGFSAEQAEQSPKVKELRVQLAATVDVSALENEVLSDLANFFRRYYQGGDFLALRRYKAGVYAIPYEGEEVKLHWANADQYYIKTSEFLRDYTFKLADGKRVHFKLVEADTEADNKKSAAGQERRFILCATNPLVETDGDLVIRFEYRPDPDKRKQAELNTLASETILNVPGFAEWKAALAARAPTEKNPNRTLLEKHLGDYTARNSFDYFIHKDIGGFLRRELDFYIKNEIMHLDDIEAEDAPRVGQYLAKIKAIRAIARKIIAFLEQLENFQKKLWLKKKFVVETNYCVTLDRVAEALYPEIAANDAQRSEWVKLFAVDEIKANAPAPAAKQGELISAPDAKRQTSSPGYTVPLTVEFLKANPSLVLDTKFFPAEFKEKLLADNKILGDAATLDEASSGLLIHSENFHALNLMHGRFREQVSCIFTDPPYNTGLGDFAYKDNYQHSSWVSLMFDRLGIARELLSDSGSSWVTVDDGESGRFRLLAEQVFGNDCFMGDIAWEKVYSPRMDSVVFSTSYDHVFVFSKKPAWSPNRVAITPDLEQFPHSDDKGRRYRSDPLRKWGKGSLRADRPNLWFAIKSPTGVEVWPLKPDGTEGRWRWEKSTVTERYAELDWLDKGNGLQPYVRQYADQSDTRPVETLWKYTEAGSTHESQEELKAVLPNSVFTTPKPTKLVAKAVTASGNSNSIVLDYFGGSGTTGHAVIKIGRAHV